jgi:DNA repair protein RadC
VCAYRPVRDREGRIISVPSLALNNPQAAAQIIARLLADQPVEIFAVACLSARNRILAWYVVSRGTRSSTPVSIPDVFVPACVTPGTVSLLVAHNHPSGDPTPSTEDLELTERMLDAGDVMGIHVVDHIILSDHRYFSLQEAGLLAIR